MFGMKTSDLFRRAKQLADLEGSNFISWNESINCINEANVGLYEKLINIGDNSFVKSFRTNKESEVLPEDFWQLKGVYLWNNGNLQVINRRADNNGTHHLSYEIRNGFINLFGNPDDVLIEYFPKPKKLFYKPDSFTINLDDNFTYLDCHKHTFLYKSVNQSSNDTLSLYDLDGVKTLPHFMLIDHNLINGAYLTENFVFVYSNNSLRIYDIATGNETITNQYRVVITESGKEYLLKTGGIPKIYSFQIKSDSNLQLQLVSDKAGIPDGRFIVCNDDFKDYYYIDNDFSNLYHLDKLLITSPKKIIYSNKHCYCLTEIGFFVFDENDNQIETASTGINVGFVGIDERTGFGYCSKKYGKYYINSYCEDTPLNYPNSTYFQIISYLLAIAFKSKQGADITLLQNQLAMIEQTFEDTLGSDAFQFPRMGNVYN